VQVQDLDSTRAMNQASIALIHAKRASFNHEMLALLYFPDEHKWAVYTPLFGPIGERSSDFNVCTLQADGLYAYLAVPLLVALNREIKEWRRRRREAQKSKLKAE